MKACRLIKSALVDRLCGRQDMRTRRQYVTAAISELRNTKTFRGSTVGPLFLRPEWCMERRDRTSQMPNFDRQLLHLVNSAPAGDIRIVFRNTERFRQKLDVLVPESERARFVHDTLAGIERLWGSGERGPDLICRDTGHTNIDLIFDAAVLSTFRRHQFSPIEYGYLSRNQHEIDWAIQRFDSVFDAASRGREIELSQLKAFVVTLWTTS